MSLFLLPHQEIEDNDDYQRWQFEAQRAEWEQEQAQACAHTVARLQTIRAKDRQRKVAITIASCRACGDVLASRVS